MWFRRDLRADDNAALYHALKSCKKLYCVFVFDKEILASLPRADRRVEFIRESLVDLDAQLGALAAPKPTSLSPALIVRQRGLKTRYRNWPMLWACKPCLPTTTTSRRRWRVMPWYSVHWPTKGYGF